jgi:Cu+-exporting ATPase
MFPILQEKPAGVRDPVCGMTVNPQRAAGSVVHQGQTYYFCSSGCATKFQASPEKYLVPQNAPEPMRPEAAGVEYTCPMHPEVRQLGPGSCPKCGMALEPVSFTRESADEVNPEYKDMLRRFWLSVPTSAGFAGDDVLRHALALAGTGAG